MESNNTNTRIKTKQKKPFLLRLLITAIVVRWIWVLGVEHMPKVAAVITSSWLKVCAGPAGVWFRSFNLGSKTIVRAMQPVWPALWKALLVKIPVLILVIWLICKYFPTIRTVADRVFSFAARLHRIHAQERHTILRFVDPQNKEHLIDLGAIGTQDLGYGCMVTEDIERGVVEITDGNRTEVLQPELWYRTTGNYKVQLLYTTI